MVDHPFTVDYEELLAMPLVEQYVTIACVSNEVGGDLVGTPCGAARGCATCSTGPACRRAPRRWWAVRSTAWLDVPSARPVAVAMNGDPLPPGTATRRG